MQTADRYIVTAPAHDGTYFEESGWHVVNATDGHVVAATNERHARQYARSLNARNDHVPASVRHAPTRAAWYAAVTAELDR